jgi:abequosyltransferase
VVADRNAQRIVPFTASGVSKTCPTLERHGGADPVRTSPAPDAHLVPLLSICIPTWNRCAYLAQNLAQLHRELDSLDSRYRVEVLVSDNASDDQTHKAVQDAQEDGLNVRYVRNAENLGSDRNIAQCFNLATGAYVMLLGDDDLLVDGALSPIIEVLRQKDVGVVTLKAYGYENDFREEFPGGPASAFHVRNSAPEFIVDMGVMSTLISANIVAKHLLPNVDASQYCGSSLVQAHLVYSAALSAKRNVCFDSYMIACKRNNSGGYAFSEVFVDRFSEILDGLATSIGVNTVGRLEDRLLRGYYPFYVWRIRRAITQDSTHAWLRFYNRFHKKTLFWIFVAPTFLLPRPLGIAWGATATVIGRTLEGDFRRGIYFARYRLQRMFQH